MTEREPLILFSRRDCHLCDLVVEMMDRAGIPWRPVDIDGDQRLVEKYGLRIPVLKQPGSERELFFPFDEDDLVTFFGAGP